MKHKIAFGVGIFLLLGMMFFGVLGCATKAPATSATTFVTTDTFNTTIGQLNATLGTKANQSDVAVQSQRIDNLAGQSSGANTYPKAELYTRAEVDATIAAAVKALKDNQAWITGGTGTTTTTGGATTTVSGISVNLDKTQVISTSTDTGNKDVTVTVTNASGASKNISLLISLTPISACDNVTTYTAKSTLTGFTTAQTGIKQLNPDVATLIAKIYWVAPDFYLDNGATKTIWLNFDVKTNAVITWTLNVKAL